MQAEIDEIGEGQDEQDGDIEAGGADRGEDRRAILAWCGLARRQRRRGWLGERAQLAISWFQRLIQAPMLVAMKRSLGTLTSSGFGMRWASEPL